MSGEVLDDARFPAKVLRTLGNDALDGLANCAHALSTSNRGKRRPQRLTSDEVELAPFITEETYDALRVSLATLLGQYDSYLETFMPDMRYSDTPIAAFISENLADLYQDLGNFVSLFREEHEPTMHAALALCTENFRLYWGQALLNALKALHALRYNEEISLTDPTE